MKPSEHLNHLQQTFISFNNECDGKDQITPSLF